MKYIIAFILTITILSSCKKDEFTQAIAYLKNTTNHNIKILFYKNGIVASTDTIKLGMNQEVEIANGPLRGLVRVPGFSTKYAIGSDDSVVVVFDNIYKVSHYVNLPANLFSKYYQYNSLRNIGNAKSYIFTSTQVASTKLTNVHRYEFVEADYNYAR
jgi:hypothetical protein